MSDDWEWPLYEELMVLDGGLDHRPSVSECPRCAAIVRTESKEKHEGVCWQ